jgi:hypothetical protein
VEEKKCWHLRRVLGRRIHGARLIADFEKRAEALTVLIFLPLVNSSVQKISKIKGLTNGVLVISAFS